MSISSSVEIDEFGRTRILNPTLKKEMARMQASIASGSGAAPSYASNSFCENGVCPDSTNSSNCTNGSCDGAINTIVCKSASDTFPGT